MTALLIIFLAWCAVSILSAVAWVSLMHERGHQ